MYLMQSVRSYDVSVSSQVSPLQVCLFLFALNTSLRIVFAPTHNRGIHADVYCPNCGEKGHHIDYPAFDPNAGGGGSGSASYGTCCKAPKYEAFVKFPKCKLLVVADLLFLMV